MKADQIALVTGGNRGIGFETCRQLAARGFKVVLTARRAADANRAADRLVRDAVTVMPMQLDVTDQASVDRAKQEVARNLGALDALVNNAAILLGENDSVFDIDDETFNATIDTNVLGALRVSRAFAPAMIERGHGRIVNVSSSAGQLSTMGAYAPAYSISKTALSALTRVLAAEMKGTGVLVNSACPGWVRTDMGGPHAPRSVEQGADTIVWLATLPKGGPTGKFFRERRPIDW